MTVALYFEIYSLLQSHRLQGTRAIILRDKHPGFWSFSSPDILSRSSLRPPFLKKGPLKLQTGAHWALIGQFLQ